MTEYVRYLYCRCSDSMYPEKQPFMISHGQVYIDKNYAFLDRKKVSKDGERHVYNQIHQDRQNKQGGDKSEIHYDVKPLYIDCIYDLYMIK